MFHIFLALVERLSSALLVYSMEEPWLLVRSVVTLLNFLYSMISICEIKNFVLITGYQRFCLSVWAFVSINQEKRLFMSIEVWAYTQVRSRSRYIDGAGRNVRELDALNVSGLEAYMLIFGQWWTFEYWTGNRFLVCKILNI